MNSTDSRVSLMQDKQARRVAWLSLTSDVRVARRHDDGCRERQRVRFLGGNVGTWAFDNDDALDLLDALSEQDTIARRQVLSQCYARPGSTRRT